MFHLVKKKTHFEMCYSKLISFDTVKKCVHHKAITAAYLFVLSDFMWAPKRDEQRRLKNALQILDTLKKHYLSNKELEVFDRALAVFAQILNQELLPRGDWCLYRGERDNPFFNLYLCYGDLIYNSEYLDDYSNAQILIRTTSDIAEFITEFESVHRYVIKYMEWLDTNE
ncbi:MAG: hypothetical protein IJW30_00990 [Clostridia bacterium]|nr:hypothetical protein [Clostridia bacterium]